MNRLCLLLPLCLLAASVAAGAPESGTGTFAEEAARARRLGVPLTPRDMIQRPLAPGQDAGPLYLRLDRMVRRTHLAAPDRELLESRATLPMAGAKVAATRAVLARIHDQMEIIDRATDLPECRLPQDWSRGAEIGLGPAATMRNAARHLRARAMVLWAEGRRTESLGSIRRIFRLATHAAGNRTVLAHLIAYLDQSIGLAAAAAILEADRSPATARAISALMDDAPRLPPSRRALEGELVMSLAEIDKMSRHGKAYLPVWLGAQDVTRAVGDPPLRQRVRARVTWHHTQAILALGRPFPECLRATERLGRIEAEWCRGAGQVGELVELLTAGIDEFTRSRALQSARSAVVRAAAQILAQHANGTPFPEVVAGLPVDPFTGRPLKYRAEGTGFVVYSVGPTGRFAAPLGRARPMEAVFRLQEGPRRLVP